MAYIKINRENFFHNLNQIALKTGSIDKIAIVLKDNAYGHGLDIMAGLAQEYGIKQAVVISQAEADIADKYFEHILILNAEPFEDDKLSFVVADMSRLAQIEPRAQIELKVDTGMHRNGISIHQLDKALSIIKERGIHLVGVMTHYRSADILSSELAWQQHNFEQVKRRVVDAGYANIRFHSHNSATILRVNDFDEDIVRLGIGAYGYNELPSAYNDIELRPVLSLWAKRVSTRVLKRGERVGYGGDFTATRDMTISTYGLGYGDGWMRSTTLPPYTTPDGLDILGRVSMDFISLQSDKDKLCIMSNAQTSAQQLGTISYEMTTMLSSHLSRIVV